MIGRVLPCGETAVLVEVESGGAVAALAAALAAASWPGVVDIVPAARTLLVGTDSPARLDGLRPRLAQLLAETDPTPPLVDIAQTLDIPVVYEGPDLAEVARLTGLSPSEVVSAHSGREWRVAFGGFAPGFAYLTGGDPRLTVPRRAEPRTIVPTGSVGLAGEFSGIYPRSSPGGWQLIGRTDVALWDADRDPPALLRPGWFVRFVEVATSAPALEGPR